MKPPRLLLPLLLTVLLLACACPRRGRDSSALPGGPKPLYSPEDLMNLRSGSTLPIRTPGGSPLKDGSSLLSHIFSSLQQEEDKKTAPSSGAAEAPAPGQKPPASPAAPPASPAPQTRRADAGNFLLLLKSGSRPEKLRAMVFAATRRDRRAVPVLARMLRNEDTMSGYAAEALGVIGGRQAAAVLSRSACSARVGALRSLSLQSLAFIDDPAADAFLLKFLSHQDRSLRLQAAAIAAARGVSGADSALDALVSDPSEPQHTRIWAAAAVERSRPGDTDARRTLLSGLHCRDRSISALTVRALSVIRTTWAAGQIAGLVYSDDPVLSREILSLLLTIPRPDALAALDGVSAGLLHTARYKAVRCCIAGRPEGNSLHDAIMSQDPLARDLAVEAAGMHRINSAVPALVSLARSTTAGSEYDRAVRALASIGTRDASDALALLGEDSSHLPASPSEQLSVTRIYTDPLGDVRGVMISNGREESLYAPGRPGPGGWNFIEISGGCVILENASGRRLSLPAPTHPIRLRPPAFGN
ncbi:MAG: HEAT repeat domain-containing protein [Planctomycetes bacterium]|nr:HEAT repeat domain-containing protein [Planctomycetota bacterium]